MASTSILDLNVQKKLIRLGMISIEVKFTQLLLNICDEVAFTDNHYPALLYKLFFFFCHICLFSHCNWAITRVNPAQVGKKPARDANGRIIHRKIRITPAPMPYPFGYI